MPEWLDELLYIEIGNKLFPLLFAFTSLIAGFALLLISMRFDGKVKKSVRSFGYAGISLFASYVFFSTILFLARIDFIIMSFEIPYMFLVVIRVVCGVLLISGAIRLVAWATRRQSKGEEDKGTEVKER